MGPALTGCEGDAEPKEQAEPTLTAIPKNLQIPDDKAVHDPRRVLALVPASADTLTLTDYDEIRDRLGYQDFTSDDLVTDRTAFWERADKDAVMLTDGLLRDQHSRLWLDYGFTQDDVDWEARFTGPDGPGYVLGFRPDQDMAEVAKAVKDDVAPLEDATVLEEQHLVVSGIADEGDPVWAFDPTLTDLPAVGVESSYVHRGCIPVKDALGPDADFEDQDALTSKYDVRGLMPLDAFSVNFDDATATARTDRDRVDLLARKDLIDIWPETGSITWKDAFEGMPVADPSTGRIGWHVRNPVAAANLVLTDHLPFAVCNELVPFEEPTGL
ncbi:hypothetical protein ASG90_18295 [Nocardioides sp. Soil797]|nr:hypothetical protein ASG90_18295 [Nocardioides sp. Soil797]